MKQPYSTPYCFRQLVDWYIQRCERIWCKIQEMKRDYRILQFCDFEISPHLDGRKLPQLAYFEATGSIFFTCKYNFIRGKNLIFEAAVKDHFLDYILFMGPRRKEVGGKEASQTMTKIQVLCIKEKSKSFRSIYNCLKQ